MRRVRVIPVLLLEHNRLVKTARFSKPNYIGDPINAVKIFNEKEVDELLLLDISASRSNKAPDFEAIQRIAGEAFMPMGYGGGVKTLDDIRRVLWAGFEKIVFSTSAFYNKQVISQGAALCGSQSMVVVIDYRRNIFGKSRVFVKAGTENTKKKPVEFAREMEEAGAGEIVLQSIERDGMFSGYDLETIAEVSSGVSIPVVVCGGASSVNDFLPAIRAGASAVAAGSIFVYRGAARGILPNYPSQEVLKSELYNLI
jgi:imidazole glycerol-phosphate synthase subunit HisF